MRKHLEEQFIGQCEKNAQLEEDLCGGVPAPADRTFAAREQPFQRRFSLAADPALAIRLNVVQPGCSRSVSIDVRCWSERVLRPGPGLADGAVIATFPSQRPSLGNVIEGRVFREGRGDLSGVRAGESLAEGPPFGQRLGASLAAHRSTRGPKKRPRGSATAWPRHWGRVRAAARSTPSNPAGGPQA